MDVRSPQVPNGFVRSRQKNDATRSERKGCQQDALFAPNASSRANNVSRGLSLSCGPRAKKSSSPTLRTRQNQLIRTNHSRRTRLVSTPVRIPSPCPPCLCDLCVKFPFPASLFIASFAPETRLVAQVASAVIVGQRDLRLLSAKAHTCSMCNFRRMKSC
jgi:hypothetical protein